MAIFLEMELEINKAEIENIKKYIHLHGGTRINIEQVNDTEYSWLSWDQEDEIYYDSESDQQIDYISELCKNFIENNYATKESVMKMIESSSLYLSEVQYDSMQINLEKDDFKKIYKKLNNSKERETIKHFKIPNSVEKIGDYTFQNCTNLESIEIPNSVTEIGVGAFHECKNLKSILIPDSVEKIGAFAFADCESLKSITFPDSVIEIGDYAFEHCKNLQSITIPNSVKKIRFGAFYNCESLESITIPEKFKYQLRHFGIDESKVNVKFTKSKEREM